MVIDAEGSGSDCTSVYLIRAGANDLQAIIGNGGNVQIDTSVVVPIDDGAGGRFSAYHTPILGWLGLQAGSAFSFARIANIDSGKPLDDELIYRALKLFPAGRQPNLIVMNRTALEMLRASRTATNQTGAPAPRPTDVEGIAIVTTDAIGDAEDALTAASS
jgi:hypothetical protein